MTTLLALDTATDALSVALSCASGLRVSHQIMPRRHQQQLFVVLDELLAGDTLRDCKLDAIVFGSGPGSFTGLRIAVSAAQGLGFSLGVPLIGISSLETQARTLLRRQALTEPCVILSTIDARIQQLYAASFVFDGQALRSLGDAAVSAPADLVMPDTSAEFADVPVFGVGSGYAQIAAMPAPWQQVSLSLPELLPEAQDMLAPARLRLASGDTTLPADALPNYVQRGSNWKTLAEQGKKA